MIHPIHRVVSFAIVAPYTLSVTFDDTTTQVIDFSPILEGELYGPLRMWRSSIRSNSILRSVRWWPKWRGL